MIVFLSGLRDKGVGEGGYICDAKTRGLLFARGDYIGFVVPGSEWIVTMLWE